MSTVGYTSKTNERANTRLQTCFFHLRRLRQVRRLLGRDVTANLVAAFVLSRLDYCNALLAGLPYATIAPLQRVINAMSDWFTVWDYETLSQLSPSNYVGFPLTIEATVQYTICLLVHLFLNVKAPSYSQFLHCLLEP